MGGLSVRLKRFIPDSQDNAFLALLIFVGAIASTKDIFGLMVPNDYAIYPIVAIVIWSVGRHILRQLRNEMRPHLPSKPGYFNPFRISTVESPFIPWPRNIEMERLTTKLSDSIHSHLLVTGPSGAGKSTLVRDLLLPLISNEYTARYFNRYDSIIVRLINACGTSAEAILRQRVLEREYRTFIKDNFCSIQDISDQTFLGSSAFLDSGAERVWAGMASFLTKELENGHTSLFIFDQIERLFHLIKISNTTSASDTNGYNVYFFISLVRLLRELKNVRTIFIIRAEYLYQSFDFLENATTKKGDALEVRLTHFLCPGINTTSAPEAMTQIYDAFTSIEGAGDYAHAFEIITGLNSRELSNTFMLQLCGFVVQNFYASDNRVRDLLKRQQNRQLSLRYYFDYLLNDYACLHSASEDLEFMKAIIFTIAIENRVTGQSITIERIGALAHVPSQTVEIAVAFLRELGLVHSETRNNEVAYRLVHDIISDYVIENEQFAINLRLKDGIRGLSEARAPTEKVTRVNEYPNPLTDLISNPNVGLLAIWSFYILGALKARFVEFCIWSYTWLSWVWESRDCQFVSQFYTPIYFMHAIWMTFIYHLDRGFFRYTLRNPLARFLSKMMPVLGATQAIIFCHSPTLFLVPVVSVGLLMAILLIWGVIDGSFAGRIAKESSQWGVRTLFNMLFAATLMVVTALVLWPEPGAQAFWDHVATTISSALHTQMPSSGAQLIVGWMYFANFIMIYFWWHVRPEQQTPISLAAFLALHDRTHIEDERNAQPISS